MLKDVILLLCTGIYAGAMFGYKCYPLETTVLFEIATVIFIYYSLKEKQ